MRRGSIATRSSRMGVRVCLSMKTKQVGNLAINIRKSTMQCSYFRSGIRHNSSFERTLTLFNMYIIIYSKDPQHSSSAFITNGLLLGVATLSYPSVFGPRIRVFGVVGAIMLKHIAATRKWNIPSTIDGACDPST